MLERLNRLRRSQATVALPQTMSLAAEALPTAHEAGDARENLLTLELTHVRYGLVPALRGVTLTVREGEMVALLGANGAGKTTTLRAISGLVKPHAGRIIFDGQRIDRLSPTAVVARGIAHMPEGRDLFPGLTVLENLRYGYFPQLKRNRRGFKAALGEVYDAFPKLKQRHQQKAGTLSGGEQQMLAAGMALISAPRLLLVDELSLGLAPQIVEQLFAVLRQVNEKQRMAILLVEQFVPLALANTQRAYVLAKGEVAMARTSSELRDDPELISSYLGGHVGEEEPAELVDILKDVGHATASPLSDAVISQGEA